MVMIRSWLFVPGHRQKMIDKSPGRGSDALIYDLEDAVPPGEMNAARVKVGAALDAAKDGPHRFVRIHGSGHGAMDADLRAVVRPGLVGLVLPKVDRPEDVLTVDRSLTELESQAGMAPGSVRLAAMIESAVGLIQAPAIAASSPRLAALMFGAEDFAVDLGLFSFRQGGLLAYVRSALVVAAASAKLAVVDKVHLDFRDPAGLARETQAARELGFTGKLLIHPAQIDAVHHVFRPTDQEVESARRVVAAFEAAPEEGTMAVDGKMVDLPVVKRAQWILRSASKRESSGRGEGENDVQT